MTKREINLECLKLVIIIINIYVLLLPEEILQTETIF